MPIAICHVYISVRQYLSALAHAEFCIFGHTTGNCCYQAYLSHYKASQLHFSGVDQALQLYKTDEMWIVVRVRDPPAALT